MAQSLSQIYLHCIFSTKHREALLQKKDLIRVFRYIEGIILNFGGIPVEIGGIENHVHLLFSMPKTLSCSQCILKIKSNSSKWIKCLEPAYEEFGWQNGYASFSVSSSGIPAVKRYIQNQEAHHQKISFKNELIKFLHEYNVEYDEDYIWK